MLCLGMAFGVTFLLGGEWGPQCWRSLWGRYLPVLASCHGFNLDVEEPQVFREDGAGFGQSVVQFSRSRLVVGAPLEVVMVNETGRLYSCNAATGLCQPISLHTPPGALNMSLGLSLAASINCSQLLACGPTAHRVCGKNMYVEGSCLLLDSQLQSNRTVPEAQPVCPHSEMDIAFLMDGSGSIDPSDFKRMKDFVRAVMGQFEGTNTLFSLMQYSNLLKTHFTFTKFQTSASPQSLVDSIIQLKGLTYTATGILTVVKELFHRTNGARKSAKKILIVITDGQKYKDPLEYTEVIPQAEEAGIIRYAIGVGGAFQETSARQELDAIGSAPSQDHVFKVDNFEALGSIQKQLQEKIFAVEGTQSRTSSSFQYEMSQKGFSSVFTMDGPVLGAVGSFDWSGGAFLYPPNTSPTFINMSQENEDMRDSYLGYSTELALWKGVQSLVLGAPRHQHTGKVVIFIQESRQWRPKAEVTGTQIGSYFGASLCSVDVDRDGSSDLVLIGAPHYYDSTRGGQVSVCPLPRRRARWQCEAILRGEQGHPWGRFGTALTVLGDVNGDKLTDIAIGAPGEQENSGAVYLFHGTSGLGVSPSHSQRIAGSQFSPRLQYFGQSLSGGQDLTQDGLVDLAVGAQGHALLLRTRPVLRVSVSIHTMPTEISRSMSECREQTSSFQTLGDANVCLHVYASPKDRLRDLQSTVTFDLTLDPGRLSPRAIFKDTSRPQARSLPLTCESAPAGSPGIGSARCSIKHLIFREGAQMTFTATFDVSPKAQLGDRLLLTANVSSENNSPRTSKRTSQLEVPVKYAVYSVISSHEESTRYLNFSASGEKESSMVQHRYQVNNLGARDLPISINFLVPVELNQVSVWTDVEVSHPQNLSIQCSSERIAPTKSNFLAHIQENPVLNCSMADCLRFRCDVPSFGIQEELDFILKGNLSFGWISQTLQKKVLVVSVAEITFNRSVYSQLPGQEAFLRAQVETVLEEYEVHNPVPLIVGSSVGGLLLLALITATLYKLGFFKRQYKQMLNNKPEDIATLNEKDFSHEAPHLPSS
ncbi:PREDICTED: integrin alpha-D-like [Hipposideros armiger]|uniref:Integrin alpha-D-like n=1 Tax=Hipposideros armiger TaxID=186990 RepID=A0A8B7QMD5_HIPAR|nr:PREDICTED: integrin alpha-D-like [Hipposideros armiger]